MTGADIIAGIILVALAIAIAVYLLHWLYRRSSKDVAFVRTGLGGEKVVLSGGAFVLPIIHDVTMVGMSTLRIEVKQGGEKALITANKMRVQVVGEFYVRVRPTHESLALAAQSLGSRTLEPERLRELVEGRFIDALGVVAAKMTMDEMQEQRGTYAKEVRALVEQALTQTGLELETVSITGIDQASLDSFDPSNAFDAEGLTQLTQQIEARKKLRNDIEQDTRIQIRNKNLEAEKQTLFIEQESEFAKLQQEREIANAKASERRAITIEKTIQERDAEIAQLRAAEEIEKTRIAQQDAIEVERSQREQSLTEELENRRKLRNAIERSTEVEMLQQNLEAEVKALEIAKQIEIARLDQQKMVEHERAKQSAEIALEESKRRYEAEKARIKSDEEIRKSEISRQRAIDSHQIETDQLIKSLGIESRRILELEDKDRNIQLAVKASEEFLANAKREAARAKEIEAREQADTSRDVEIADRRKRIELIETSEKAESEGLLITSKARAQKEAAAELEEAEKHASLAAKLRYEIEAAGNRALNESENMRTGESRDSELRMELARKLDAIIRESVKPIENVDAIKILDVRGMPGFSGMPTNGGSDGSNGEGGSPSGPLSSPKGSSLADDVVNSALRYRAQMPFVDNLLNEIGMAPGEISNIRNILGDFDRGADAKKSTGKSS